MPLSATSSTAVSPSSASVTRATPPAAAKRRALASRLETTRLTRSGSKREVSPSGVSTTSSDAPLGGERLELLGDRAHDGGEVVVDEREPRLAVVAADLLEHRVDLLERVQGGQADALGLGLQRAPAAQAAQALGAGEDDLQRRPQVVRELGEQPLAEVVDAGQPVGQDRQLGVLAGDPLLRALAVRNLPPLGQDQGDAPVAAAQRAQDEVDGLRDRPAAAHHQLDVEAREAAVGRQLDGAPQIGLHVLGMAAPRRLPQQLADHLVAVDARGGERRVGDVEDPPVRLQQRDEARGLGQRHLGHEAPRLGIGLGVGDLVQARLQRMLHVHRRAPGIEPSVPHCGWFPSRAPSTIGEIFGRRVGASLPVGGGGAVKNLALGWPGA